MFPHLWTVNCQLFQAINGLGSSRTLSALAATLNDNHVVRFVILAAPYAFYWFGRRRSYDRERILLTGLVSVLVAIVVARGLANTLPFETRPIYDSGSGYRPVAIGVRPDMESWSSFPSDTAAVCIALPFALFWINRSLSVALLACALVLFCIPRIMIGVHYPLDILVGGLIGLASVWSLMQVPASAYARVHGLMLRIPERVFYPAMILYLSEASQMFNGLRALKGLVFLRS